MDDGITILSEIKALLEAQAIGQKEIMNLQEAKTYLGVSDSLLYKLTSTNKITHYKPGGKILYFKKEDLDAWMLQNRVTSIAEEEEALSVYLTRK